MKPPRTLGLHIHKDGKSASTACPEEDCLFHTRILYALADEPAEHRIADLETQLAEARADANDWKCGMAGQEDKAKELESLLAEKTAALQQKEEQLAAERKLADDAIEEAKRQCKGKLAAEEQLKAKDERIAECELAMEFVTQANLLRSAKDVCRKILHREALNKGTTSQSGRDPSPTVPGSQ